MRRFLAVLLAAVALLGLGATGASADSLTTPNKIASCPGDAGNNDYNVSITWARPTATTTRPTLVKWGMRSSVSTAYTAVNQAVVHYGTTTERTGSGLNSKGGTYTFIAGSLVKRPATAYVVLLLTNGQSCTTPTTDPFRSY